MAIKKSELYSSLWASCDELRGGMDASQYKDYVLTLLFVKYVTDKSLSDPKFLIVVPKGGSFNDMVALKGNKEIGEGIDKIISKLAEANDLRGTIDIAYFNDEEKLGRGKDMIDRLSKLVGIFEGLDLGANSAQGDDLLGDAYEYLMRNFATESGKSKGQFYTPAEVSRIMAKVVGIADNTRQDKTVYDPTCGSGSLLLKVSDEAPRGLTIYGQENDGATAALARMNMILHNMTTAEIWKGNTLSAPCPDWRKKDGSLETFDFVVANPPFSYKSWSNGVDINNDEFGRFEYGIPPAKNGDYAFLLHILKSIKSKGKAAVILPHGVLFRGNTEGDIRRRLIQQGYIKAIIGLPVNLFYGTSIPACIIVIDKENAHTRKGIFIIDASREFVKDGNKNRLRARDIHRIVDTYLSQAEKERYSRMIGFSEIEKNDFNLNIPRYIDSSEPEDIHDLDAHLNGDIPERDVDALEEYWKVFSTLRPTLFTASSRKNYNDFLVEPAKIRATILEHQDFKSFSKKINRQYKAWKRMHVDELKNLKVGINVKMLIHTLSESLLAHFAHTDLVDKYSIYQILMKYWDETMQDDVYLLAQVGWNTRNTLRELVSKTNEKIKEDPDFTIDKKKYKSDLIPPTLIIARYFSDQQSAIDKLRTRRDSISLELKDFIEEHSGEEGMLEDARSDKGKITKSALSVRIKEIKENPEFVDEILILSKCQKLLDAESAASKSLKENQQALDKIAFSKYLNLSTMEIKSLIVDDKWLTDIEISIQAEIERVVQQLVLRIQVLEVRYAETLPNLMNDIDKLSKKVEGHLRTMGVSW